MTNQENGVDLKSAAVTEEKKLFIETYGCQMNVADSEVVASIMKMDGYAVTDKIEDADAISSTRVRFAIMPNRKSTDGFSISSL